MLRNGDVPNRQSAPHHDIDLEQLCDGLYLTEIPSKDSTRDLIVFPNSHRTIESFVINALRNDLTSFSTFVTSWLQSLFSLSEIALGFKLSTMLKTSAAFYSLHRNWRLCYRRLHFWKSRGPETANCAFYRTPWLSVRETWCCVDNCGSLEFLQFSMCVTHRNVYDQKFYKYLIHSLEFRCICVQMLCSLWLVSRIPQSTHSVSHLLAEEELVIR